MGGKINKKMKKHKHYIISRGDLPSNSLFFPILKRFIWKKSAQDKGILKIPLGISEYSDFK